MATVISFGRVLSLLPIFAFLAVAQGSGQPPQCPVQKPDKCLTTDDIKNSMNDFTIRSFKQLAATKTVSADSNVVLYPMHLSTALLVACAASTGPAHDEIIAALHLGTGIKCEDAYGIIQYLYRTVPHRMDPPTKFDDINAPVNRLYVDKNVGLRPEFVKTMQATFNQTPGVEDFQKNPAVAISDINKWVKEQSSGKIQNLVNAQTINKDTTVTLVNANYLEFPWSNQFDPKNTVPGVFRLLNGTNATVSMMVNNKKQYMYLNNLDGKAIENAPPFEMVDMMHKWATGSLLVFVPKNPEDLAKLEAALSPAMVDQAFRSTKRTLMNLHMPTFTVESVTDVSKIAAVLGIKTLFSKDADFSPMTDSKAVSLNGMAHKAMIDVNEQGLKAAAAIAVASRTTAMSKETPINVTIDRPFLFVIRMREQEFLSYIGRVTNPARE